MPISSLNAISDVSTEASCPLALILLYCQYAIAITVANITALINVEQNVKKKRQFKRIESSANEGPSRKDDVSK